MFCLATFEFAFPGFDRLYLLEALRFAGGHVLASSKRTQRFVALPCFPCVGLLLLKPIIPLSPVRSVVEILECLCRVRRFSGTL